MIYIQEAIIDVIIVAVVLTVMFVVDRLNKIEKHLREIKNADQRGKV